MPNDTTTATPKPIQEGATNPARGSKVEAQAEHAPMLFLRPETGEIIAVPVPEVNELNKEIGEWNSLVATLQDANAQVQYFEEEYIKLTLEPDRTTPGALEEAEKNWEFALDWQEEVVDTCQVKIKSLAKIGTAGKQLVELIPLPTAPSTQTSNKPAEYKDGKYSKVMKGSWATGKKRTPSRDWIRPPRGSLVYVPSDKLKRHWPTFKDATKTKWSDVIARDANGKRTINKEKAVAYGKEAAKFQLKDLVKLEVDIEGSIGSWATLWNSDTANKYHKEGKLTAGPVTGDIELDAGAQFMRYLYGASLNGTFEPFKGNVSFRAEGHAEVAFAEAKASAAIYFPRKEGWMWTLPAGLADKDAAAKDIDLGAVRFMAQIEVKGAVGASIAAEVSLGIETKTGQMPRAVGRRTKKRGKRRARTVIVHELGDEKQMRVAGVDAGLNAFAGLKADAEIKGAIEWRNPEDKKKAFEAFANVAPAVAGLAGIGGNAKLTVQYVDGVFKVHADAGLCVGLGAEGKISFEVNVKLLLKFIKWLFYQLYHANFKRLDYIQESAFNAARDLAYLAISLGESVEKRFGMAADTLAVKVRQVNAMFDAAEERQRLAQRILSDPDALRYAPPETKGMLIHQLCNDGNIDWAKSGFGLGDDFLRDQKLAIQYILRRWSHTRTDCRNVIQHMTANGRKGNYEENMARLQRFFREEAPFNRDLPGIDSRHGEDFDAWYNQLTAMLMDEPTRGYPIMPSDSIQYAMQRDAGMDHPLFASTGDRAFYA